jgi:ABC-2 type transport system ATP-binding protein
VLHEPELVLLDEPTVGVDPQSRNAIFDSIEALRAQGRTLVYSTHYMEEAVRLCDRVAIMDAGKVRAIDTVAGLIRTYGGPPRLHVRTGGREVVSETRDPLAELNRLSAEAPLESFRVEEPTLEQVFLSLTGHTLRD